MRLIDANTTLQRFIQETEDSGKNVIHINTIKRLLQDIDTAYDVDKVVKRLKKKENEAVLKTPNTDDLHNTDYQKWMMKSYGFKEAIEIVKAGGVNE